MMVDILFIAYAAHARRSDFVQLRSTLYPDLPNTLAETRSLLQSLDLVEAAHRTDSEYGWVVFDARMISKLSVSIRYEIETERLLDAHLFYYASESVDLATGEGVHVPMERSWPVALVACGLLALLWIYGYPKWKPWTRILLGFAYAALLAGLLVVLSVVTMNYAPI